MYDDYELLYREEKTLNFSSRSVRY